MKKVTISVYLYAFNELSVTAKTRAVNDHRAFLLSVMSPDDFISGDPDYDTPEKLQETFESEYEYYLNNDEPIIESIEINEYLFYENGELAHACTYKAGENRGKTIVKIEGVDYIAVDVA